MQFVAFVVATSARHSAGDGDDDDDLWGAN